MAGSEPKANSTGPIAAASPVITIINFLVLGLKFLKAVVAFCILSIIPFVTSIRLKLSTILLPTSAKAIFMLSFKVLNTPASVPLSCAIPPANLPPSPVAS